MKIKPFKLERYFARYEFSARYLLSSSDSQALSLHEVLALADSHTERLWNDLTLGYTESSGHPLLRQEIAGLYNHIASDQVLVSAPEEAVFLALNAILHKGDHVICTFPGYQSLYEIASSLGCRISRWQPQEENGWRFDPDFLEEAICPQTKMIIINFPHNPTGYLPEGADFERIVEISRKHNLYLFSDEMYRMLEYDPARRLPAACDVYPKAVSLSGMSKALGLPGARIGWLATRNRQLLRKCAGLKDYTTICCSVPSEILALITLRARERVIAGQLARIRRNLELLDGFFIRQAKTLVWNPPKAGTIAFPRLLSPVGSSHFCRQAVEDAGIMLLPSAVYDYGDSHLRLGFGRENLPQALDKLEDFLMKSQNRSVEGNRILYERPGAVLPPSGTHEPGARKPELETGPQQPYNGCR